jgi:hypothetical protein
LRLLRRVRQPTATPACTGERNAAALMSDPARPESPTLKAYAAERGLHHREHSFTLPQATQLLRHGFMREVPSVVRGDLPGDLEDAYLAQVDYVYEGMNDLKRSYFTLVLIQAPESLGFAVRVLCHDRDLSDLDMTNPDSEREVIEAEDRAVRLESEGFLCRYALFTDNDQDELSVWRLFAPTLIDWLTAEAPKDFSFELQDGALCCFVPGTLSEADDIDELCAASARVLAEVTRMGDTSTTLAPEGSRRTRIDGELAEHHFDRPPDSVKVAAKAFRHGPFIGEGAWKLGAEAFFREHAAAAGYDRIEPSEFRSSHLQTFLPGEIAQVAKRRSAEGEPETFLVLANQADYDDMGWSLLVADGRPPSLGRGEIPAGVSAERGLVKMSLDGRSLIFSSLDGGAQGRSGKELEAFLQACGSLLWSEG